MQGTLILASSVLLQFVAAALALRLIRITGIRWAWSAIAAAVALMAVRRSITLARILTDQEFLRPDLLAELVALSISILMVAGLTAIGPLFQSIKRSEQAQRESRRRFSDLVDSIDAVVWEADLDRRLFTFVNEHARILLGYSTQEWLQQTDFWKEHLHPDDRRAAVEYDREHADRGADHVFEYRTNASDGSIVWLNDSVRVVLDGAGRPCGLRGIMIDITERKQAEAQRAHLESELRQAQKMEAVGTLSAGIAHDFNNLLTAIFGYTELAKLHAVNAKTTAALEKVELAAKLAAGVTRGLLTFSRNERSHKEPHDARELIRQAIRILRRLLTDAIEIVSALPAEPVWIEADATQFQQILINLAVNSRDAMPAGGTLHISLVRQRSCVDKARSETIEADTDLAIVTVRDDGHGIQPEHLPRIFEPFFTTKTRAHGTGLGMSIVHGIVSDHGGFIKIESKPDQGTVATVTLPCCRPPDPASEIQPRPASRYGNGELVIVAEDDPQVRAITASSLTSAGLEVLQARDGAEAMRLFRAHRDEVRLVVLDVDLPLKNGSACLVEIRAMHAELPIIVSTGDMGFELDGPPSEQTVLIRKPFRMSQLNELAIRALTGVSACKER